MRCLYCGKELALLKRWTGGGEFCSDAHRQQYQEEYNQLALNRLLQAKPQADPKKADAKAAEAKARDAKTIEAKTPDSKTQEVKIRDAALALPKAVAPAVPAVETGSAPLVVEARPAPQPAATAAAPAPIPEPVEVAVERTPEPEPERYEPEIDQEPAPAEAFGFFLEFSVSRSTRRSPLRSARELSAGFDRQPMSARASPSRSPFLLGSRLWWPARTKWSSRHTLAWWITLRPAANAGWRCASLYQAASRNWWFRSIWRLLR